MSSALFTRLFAVTFSVMLLTSSLAFGGIVGVVVATHDATGTSASISVTPNVPKGIDATDFDTDSYLVTNTGTTDIVSVSVDLRGALLPDSVFDPAGSNVGDTAGKCFTADSGSAETGLLTDGTQTTAPCTEPFSNLHNGDIDQGYDVLTIEFADFNPGETFTFSADIDPTSITGSVPPGPADSSSVSGLELTGSLVSVTGADGTTVTGYLFADGSDSGATTVATPTPAAAPTIAVDGVGLDATTLSPFHVAAETAALEHTIVVGGAPAGSTVRLLGTELGRYTEGVPSGGFDLERYEANRVLSQTVVTATADANGTATFDVTLADTVAEGGYNYFVAAYDDGAGHTSATSGVVVLQYDENAGVNDAPVIEPIGSRLVQAGSDLDVAVRATDAEFDPIALSASALPAFGSFTDNGDGTGLLSLSPAAGDEGVYPITITASDGTDATTETVSVTVTEAQTGTVAHRVNAGGGAITDGAVTWADDTAADSPYRTSGSSTSYWGSTVSSTTEAVPAGTPDAIWQTARWDPISGFAGADDPEMEWEFDVPAGTLTEVRLYFAEGYSGASQPGQRVFDVSIDGSLVLDNYDIVADAGYATGTTKTFTVISDGVVDVDFAHEFQNPVVSAIEIVVFEADPGELGAVPTTVEFGTVVVGSAGSATVTLTNLGQTGDPAVTVTDVSLTGTDPGAFSATLTGPTTVAPGESTTVEVGFAPASEGTRTATVVVAHDGSNSPVEIGLLGEASASTPVGFTPGGVDVPDLENPTSLQWGPDGRLYVSEQFGRILVLTVDRNGPGQYTVTDTEIITAVQAIPNHDDDGALNTTLTTRQVTGLLVTGTASQPVLYVSSSDPRIGGQSSGVDLNLDTNSGVVSRLTKTAGGWEHVQLVRGLPRSEENHAPNGMALDPATNTLYLAQGGNTGQGAPSKQLGYLPEYAYAGAILEIDLDAIDALPTVGGVTYDLPTVQGTAEPFGGQDGLNQAKLTVDSPVQIYSPGYRNAYDVVLTTDGRLYAVDNGGSGGWGDVPVGEGTAVCTNAPNDGGLDKIDQLHLVTEGFYAGHANPTRANPDGAGVYDEAGNLLLDFDTSNTPYPFSMANPVECDARDAGEDGSLTSFADSTNGITEYTASNFGGAMQGDLLAASFTTGGPIWRLGLNAAGDALTQKEALLSNFGSLPLDVTAVGDDGLYPGTVWAVAYGANSLIVFEPADYDGGATVCTGADDPALDEDGDGYSNADEIAAGTNPCSAGSKPADADGDGVSDVTDPDDDNDGLLDTVDPFAVDATNGGATLPIVLDFEAGARPDTLFDMGLTGLLTNGTDYLDLFVSDRVAAGGIAGVFTIPATEGTARGATNTQAYGFQTGVTPGTDPFVVSSLLETPFPAADAAVTGQEAGIFLGTGDQDNYVAVLVTGDSGASGPGRIELVSEIGGTATVVSVVDEPGVVGDAGIDLRLRVDPVTGDVTASYSLDGASPVTVGTTTVPTAWVDGSAGLAVGLIATSAGPAGEFSATYDGLAVVPETTTTNSPPVLGPVGDQTVAEGATLTVPITATDADGDALTLSVSPLPAFAGFIDNGDGTASLTLAPTAGDAGSYALTVTADDGQAADTETITVTVETTASGQVLYRVNAGGASFTPASGPIWADDSGADSVYRNSGSNVGFYGSTVATLDASVPADTPLFLFRTARWDPASAPEMAWQFDVPAGTLTEVRLYFGEGYTGTDQPGQRVFDVYVDGVLALDDYDVVADVGFATGTMQTITVTSDGTVDVAFGHVVENPKLVAIELVSLGQNDGNSGPVLAPIGDRTVTEGTTLTIPVSASDADGDLLTIRGTGLPTFATFADNGDGTGTLTLAPEVGDAGSYTLTITADDGTADDSETITVTVTEPTASNDPPVLAPIGDRTVGVGTVSTVPISASDADGDLLTISASGLPTFAGFADNGDGTASLSLAPTAGDAGSYTLTISADDGQAADSETITVTVTTPATGEVYYRINAGGGSVAGSPAWADDSGADSPYRTSGSSASFYGTTVSTTDGSLPAESPIDLFRTARWDPATSPEMAWQFDVPAGTPVEVRLYFAEAWDGASQPGVRVFDVAIDGAVVLNDYDIVADVGFATGTMQAFTVTSDGSVDVAFRHVTQNPIVSAIEIVDADGVTTTPPVAVASADPTVVTTGDPVSFDGRTSSDLDGAIVTYAWDFDTDGVVDATGPTATHSFATAGTKTVTLTVVDDDNLSDTDTVTVTVSEPATGGQVLYRINAGGPAVGDWLGDASTDQTTGTAYRTAGSRISTAAAGVTTVTAAVPASTPIEIVQSARWDPATTPEMQWAFDVPAGTQIEVRLYFVDGYSGTSQPGDRVFDVSIDGTLVLNDYDIVADAGFATGTLQAFTVTSDGTVDVDFGHVVENPIVAGIEIVTVD